MITPRLSCAQVWHAKSLYNLLIRDIRSFHFVQPNGIVARTAQDNVVQADNPAAANRCSSFASVIWLKSVAQKRGEKWSGRNIIALSWFLSQGTIVSDALVHLLRRSWDPSRYRETAAPNFEENGTGRVELEGDVLSIETKHFIFRGRIALVDTPDKDRLASKMAIANLPSRRTGNIGVCASLNGATI
jgi:hypothetical protein